MIDHTARAFDTELGELIRKIREMSDMDAKQIEGAIEAFGKHDLALARQVIALDEQVDALQQDIEEEAIVTMARRQPMAVDLRKSWARCAFPMTSSGSAILPKISQSE